MSSRRRSSCRPAVKVVSLTAVTRLVLERFGGPGPVFDGAALRLGGPGTGGPTAVGTSLPRPLP
ncbi:hypothetical protein [Streptomyces venetus]|uniref:hypothetical protein n=1 Tax=Streptomyces venetus TaxID=1701086 RepID=UPI003C2E3263